MIIDCNVSIAERSGIGICFVCGYARDGTVFQAVIIKAFALTCKLADHLTQSDFTKDKLKPRMIVHITPSGAFKDTT